MTDAERWLWRALRGHRFGGTGFRRQAPIGAFIVDFVCHERRLIIELDGGHHAIEVRRDTDRDQWLKSKGYRVLRFWNSEVFSNPEGVLAAIAAALASRIPPSPPLPLKGGGSRLPASERPNLNRPDRGAPQSLPQRDQ